MNGDDFESRVRAIEWMVSFVGPPGEVLAGKRVVEIGSGFGCGAIACIRNGAASYVGIEPEPFGSRVIQIEDSDPGYRIAYERAAKSIDKSRVRFFEGFAHEWPGADFDIVLIADVLEHVPDPALIARNAKALLKPGGHVIASTAPLFHAAQGHHLFDHFLYQPWAHLRKGFDRDDLPAHVSAYLLGEFDTLNGVTHDQLVSAFINAGLQIASQRTITDEADFNLHADLIADRYRQLDPAIFVQNVSQIYGRKPLSLIQKVLGHHPRWSGMCGALAEGA